MIPSSGINLNIKRKEIKERKIKNMSKTGPI